MELVWSAGESVAVSQVQLALKRKKKKTLSYSTVKAILANLTDKGYLKKHSQGKANVFTAAVTRETFNEQLVRDILSALSADHRNPLLVQLVDRLASDKGTLDRLEELIARKRAEADPNG